MTPREQRYYKRILQLGEEKAELISMLKKIYFKLPTFQDQKDIGNLLKKYLDISAV